MLRRGLSRQLMRYDVCLIGGGPSGIAAALRAEQYNKKVCLIERAKIGGADLWDGALQSKTMWEIAKFYDRIQTFGPCLYKPEALAGLRIDEDKMREALQAVSMVRYKQIESALAAGVDVKHGWAVFQTPNLVHVIRENQDPEPIEADYFVIATGSKPRNHPLYPTNGVTIQTSDHFMRSPLPKSLVIIGAGVIGCEFASIAANLRTTRVNIIEKNLRMLPNEDEDVAMYIQDLLAKKGVTLHRNAVLSNLVTVDEGTPNAHVRYTIKDLETQELNDFEVERALVSIGREPDYAGLGLEAIGGVFKDGKLLNDRFGRLKGHEHIYAVGDATVDIALVNMGEMEAHTAIDHIYKPRRHLEPEITNLSTIMFLDQEVAAVGLNEQQCRQRKIAYLAARYGYDFVSRAVAMGAAEGFVKLIVTNDRQKTVLGVRAVGEHASSIVELASLAIHNQQSVYDMGELLPAYPAMTQGFQECQRMLVDRSIIKPNVFPELRLLRWTPGNYERGRAYAPLVKKKKKNPASS